MTRKHKCCWHGRDNDTGGRYCCRCSIGVKRANSIPHTAVFHCEACKKDHPGTAFLDGCPNWLEHFGKMIEGLV